MTGSVTHSTAAPRYLLVGNPTAQSGRAQRWIDEALRRMAARGMQAEFMHTEPERRTIDAVRRRLDAGGVDVVIMLGGDGTFHEVATGILTAEQSVPLAMLPSGTANDMGLSFGINRGEIERNLGIIADGHLTQLDVGRVERITHTGEVLASSYFYDSCGWGIHPDILATRNRHRDRVRRIPVLRELYRDKAIYVGASITKLLETYVSPVKFRAEVVADGVTHELEGLTDIIISAAPVYAGAWVLDRHAEPDDGVFEFVPIQGRRDWASKGLRDLYASPIWQEQLDHLGVTHSEGFQGKVFHIDLIRPERFELQAQVDGEEWGTGDRYRVQVLPHHLPLVTPEDFIPPWKPEALGRL
jgi:diacylglycerol kinase family enzyme